MSLRRFLDARRRTIRKNAFIPSRGTNLEWLRTLQLEMAKGWVFALPALFAVMDNKEWPFVAFFSILALPGLAYAAFALVVGVKAYAEKSDRLYDRHTKKTLSSEYQSDQTADE